MNPYAMIAGPKPNGHARWLKPNYGPDCGKLDARGGPSNACKRCRLVEPGSNGIQVVIE